LIAQAVELVHWVDIGEKLIDALDLKPEPVGVVTPRAGVGVGITEAPRGLLFHEYVFDEDGVCTSCRIMTPTCQFLKAQETDVATYIQMMLDKNEPKEKIIFEVEKLIRAYDPCFSCSVHFLNVDWKEECL